MSQRGGAIFYSAFGHGSLRIYHSPSQRTYSFYKFARKGVGLFLYPPGTIFGTSMYIIPQRVQNPRNNTNVSYLIQKRVSTRGRCIIFDTLPFPENDYICTMSAIKADAKDILEILDDARRRKGLSIRQLELYTSTNRQRIRRFTPDTVPWSFVIRYMEFVNISCHISEAQITKIV